MATYPRTGSILDSSTRTGLSTQILITINGTAVGAVQEFTDNQTRAMARIPEIGTDGILEVVPQSSSTYDLTLRRTVYDGLSLPEAFLRGFRNVKGQRIAFDIVVIDTFTGTGDDAVITTYENCWFASIGRTYSADNFIIQENANVVVTDVLSERGGEAVALSQGVGGSRQVPTQLDEVELLADSGIRRGTLDFDGLISAAF